MKPGEPGLSELVRAATEAACEDFTARIAPLGFRRAKGRTWIRVGPLTAAVVHLHRQGSSYGAPRNASIGFRVELSLHVLNDPAQGAVLPGPSSDVATVTAGRYHLRFNARSGSMRDRCLDDLARFLEEQGEPWFAALESGEGLLQLPDGAIPQGTRDLLREAMAGHASAENTAATLRRLGARGG